MGKIIDQDLSSLSGHLGDLGAGQNSFSGQLAQQLYQQQLMAAQQYSGLSFNPILKPRRAVEYLNGMTVPALVREGLYVPNMNLSSSVFYHFKDGVQIKGVDLVSSDHSALLFSSRADYNYSMNRIGVSVSSRPRAKKKSSIFSTLWKKLLTFFH